MFGFFKQWAENASEYRAIQNELSLVLSRYGINFMHLHPELNKFLVGVAREEGAENAVMVLNNLMDKVRVEYLTSTQEETLAAIVRTVKVFNQTGNYSAVAHILSR